jgi:hypothetical protein
MRAHASGAGSAQWDVFEKKAIFLHDRKHGQYGEALGSVAVPEIGPNVHLTAAACRDDAALVLTDGTKSYHTPSVRVGNVTGGSAGLWFYQVGERQEFANFELSPAQFVPSVDVFKAPVPTPQDWVLVLGRVKL